MDLSNLDLATKVLIPVHKPTAQKVMNAWWEALQADVNARWDVYRAACQRTPVSAALWLLLERGAQAEAAGDTALMEVLKAETDHYFEAHPYAYDPIGDTFSAVDTLSSDDLEAAYLRGCLCYTWCARLMDAARAGNAAWGRRRAAGG